MASVKRPNVVIAVLTISFILSSLLVTGCGHKEDAAPAGNYYTGPMDKKDTGQMAKPADRQ